LIYEIGFSGPYQLTMTDALLPSSPAIVVPAEEFDDEGLGLHSLIHPPSPRETPRLTFRFWFRLTVMLVAVGGLLWLSLTTARKFLKTILGPVLHPLGRLFGPSDDAAPDGSKAPTARQDICVMVSWIVVIGLGIAVGYNHRAEGGEPFELFEGVSIWPSMFIGMVTAILCVGWIAKGISDLRRDNEGRFRDSAGAGPASSIDPPESSIARTLQIRWEEVQIHRWDGSSLEGPELKHQYWHKGEPLNRVIRFLFATILFLAFGGALIALTDTWPNLPYRGDLSRWLAGIVTIAEVVALTALVFFAVDATHLSQRFVVALGKRYEPNADQQARKPLLASRKPKNSEITSKELATVRLIAERTHIVGNFILYPFTALLLFVVARNPTFDHWNFPWTLILLGTVLFLALIIHSFVLRHQAWKTRRNILERLRESLMDGDEESRRCTKLLIDEIERQNRGAFRPLSDDYVFRALAIPFGGTGGLLLLDQLTRTLV
jgi:uncharacterized membrane protein YecN with MAPEG domain